MLPAYSIRESTIGKKQFPLYTLNLSTTTAAPTAQSPSMTTTITTATTMATATTA